MSANERTGWRDLALSQRHRLWGYNCPCVDLDFLVAEYNHGVPVALVEYKERHAQPPDLSHPTYKALANLANHYAFDSSIGLPFFIATYCHVHWWFIVTPLNNKALAHYAHCLNQPLTEQRFVRSLYLLRMKSLSQNDESAICALNAILPSDNDLSINFINPRIFLD